MNTKLTATLTIALGIAALGAQSRPSGTLLVLAKADQTLSVVDPATLAVIARAPSGPDPHEVAVSADGRTAYISNYNGGGNIISVVDLVSMTPRPAIDLGPLRAPHGLEFAEGKLWFTAEASKVIGSYDPASARVDWVLGTGQNRTHMIAVARGLAWIVTSNVSSATMTFIEKIAVAGRGGAGRGGSPQTDWNETTIPVGRGAEGFDVTPDGREIWAANALDGTISIVDVASRGVTATLQAGVTGANRLKFTPDGKLALVTTLGRPDLVILDTAGRKEIKRLPVGRGAAGIQMQPDGARAFVACTPDDTVAVIDLASLTVTGRINAGRQPDGLAWVPAPR